MISFLAAFLYQRRMSEARKAAAAPRGPRDNAAYRAAYSGKSPLRCNPPAELRSAAQPPLPRAAQRTAFALRCNPPAKLRPAAQQTAAERTRAGKRKRTSLSKQLKYKKNNPHSIKNTDITKNFPHLMKNEKYRLRLPWGYAMLNTFVF